MAKYRNATAFDAIQENDLDEVKQRLKNGQKINAQDSSGSTMLHYASPEGTKLLLSKGAKATIKDNLKRTPLFYAYSAEQAKLLIKAGANVNDKDVNGDTPLHDCAPENISVLIANGAKINAKNNKGETPLHKVKTMDAAKQLLKNKANPCALDNEGRTPLMSILENSIGANTELIEFLAKQDYSKLPASVKKEQDALLKEFKENNQEEAGLLNKLNECASPINSEQSTININKHNTLDK